jgi:hypothetical protein
MSALLLQNLPLWASFFFFDQDFGIWIKKSNFAYTLSSRGMQYISLLAISIASLKAVYFFG